jgi:transcriptional regulator with XRE-family HTH domain
MKKKRTVRDEEIRGEIAKTLKSALAKRGKSPEDAARLLQVELGTLYKYLAASMIPGGHVLWRACRELGLVLDENGLRLARAGTRKLSSPELETDQYELPFINETVAGDKVHLEICKKDSQNAQYVRVALRIKVAG